MRISSTHNPIIKYVRSLERAAVRRSERVFLVEGIRLVREAVHATRSAHIVLSDTEALVRSDAGRQLLQEIATWAERHYEVEPHVLASVALTHTPSGILAVLPRLQPPEFEECSLRFGVVLDRVADPGNAGTILRTADAVNADYIVALPGTIDLYSPKVVRAGMGAHFRLPIITSVSEEFVASRTDRCLVVADARSGQSMYDFAWPQRTLLVVGSEAHGVSPALDGAAHCRVRIPMKPGVESLNASVAASLLMYAALGPTLL